MFAGPLFTRELLTAPRQLKHFFVRAGYVAALVVLMYTAGQATFERRIVTDVGDVARFGKFLFDITSVVQLTLVLAASLLFGAGSVSQEKDRRTLVLLLMTDLRDRELVIGKLCASLLAVLVVVCVSAPVLTFMQVLGGVSTDQIVWVEAICLTTGFAAGAWALLVAYWREKTFQTLAISALGCVLFIGVAIGLGSLAAPDSPLAKAAALNPYRALADVLDPLAAHPGVAIPQTTAWPAVLGLLAIGSLLLIWTILRVRVWNPSRFVYDQTLDETPAVGEQDDRAVTSSQRIQRAVWDAPIIWREVCTRAYGRKMAVIKAAYFVLAAFIWWTLVVSPGDSSLVLGMITRQGFAFVALSLVGLVLINAQAVTSFTQERDAQTLELLLVTEVSAREFVFGKLGGVFYNTKEVLLTPLVFLGVYYSYGYLTLENFCYAVIGYLTLAGFVAMLGLHSGLTYDRSRTAIVNSLGTVFFLFIGIFICMMLIVEARSSFAFQLTPFFVFILGGSLGLWASLSYKNPSRALMLASALLPFLTFYAITAYLLGYTLGVSLFITAAYGFTTVAMLVPAISEFDVALGRSAAERS